MEIGAQLYTVREFAQTKEGIENTLKKIASIGYKYIQASGIAAIDPHELRGIAEKSGLEIVVTHTNPDRVLNDTKSVINDHKILGCKHIGIGAMPPFYQGSSEGCRAFIRDFTPAAKLIADAGMKFQYHNHHFEFEKDNGAVLFDILFDEMPGELMSFILDTYWIQVAGRCPHLEVERLKGRVDVCHFKDLSIVEGRQRMAAVMEGNLNFPAIIESCEKTGVEYAMVEQDDCYGQDPFEMLAVSYRNLTAQFSSRLR